MSADEASTRNHSQKKKYNLETCTRLLFTLLQDFFASARPHRVHKSFFYRECSTLLVLPKIKYVILQVKGKRPIQKKSFIIIDFVYLT